MKSKNAVNQTHTSGLINTTKEFHVQVKKKVKLSHYMPWRHMAAEEV
jgi:hypothetical protein